MKMPFGSRQRSVLGHLSEGFEAMKEWFSRIDTKSLCPRDANELEQVLANLELLLGLLESSSIPFASACVRDLRAVLRIVKRTVRGYLDGHSLADDRGFALARDLSRCCAETLLKVSQALMVGASALRGLAGHEAPKASSEVRSDSAAPSDAADAEADAMAFERLARSLAETQFVLRTLDIRNNCCVPLGSQGYVVRRSGDALVAIDKQGAQTRLEGALQFVGDSLLIETQGAKYTALYLREGKLFAQLLGRAELMQGASLRAEPQYSGKDYFAPQQQSPKVSSPSSSISRSARSSPISQKQANAQPHIDLGFARKSRRR